MADDEEEPKAWGKLLRSFAGETTLHGARYIGAETICIRRLIWAALTLTSAAFFFWFVATRLILLEQHTTTVNVEVIYNDSIDFPTVTICNQNFFKRTAAHRHGVYDLIHDTFTDLQKETGQDNTTQDTEDIADAFEVTRDHYLSNLDATYSKYVSVTAGVCKNTCLHVDGDQCCSLVYIRATATCYITPLEYSSLHSGPGGLQLVPKEGVDYYRRKKCQVQQESSCDFDDEWCSFMNDPSSPLQWRRVQWSLLFARGMPEFDHTLMGPGMYLYASTTSSDVNLQAVFLSAYIFSFEDICIDFFYQIRAGVLEISKGLRQDTATIIWRGGPIGSRDWELARVRTSKGYFRLFFQAKMLTANDDISVAVDDIMIAPCQPALECKESIMGVGYRGNQSTARSARQCQQWSQLHAKNLPTAWLGNVAEESNFCRNPDADPVGPWCFTDIQSGRVEYCDITTCDCRGQAFQCTSGRCIAQHMVCNGRDDCGDFTDELNCKPRVNCTFQDGMNCSYTNWELSPLKWQYLQDDKNGYMALDTTDARQGHVGVLFSPVGTLNSTDLGCLQFSISLQSATLHVLYTKHPGSLWRRPVCSVPDAAEDAQWRTVQMNLTSLSHELGASGTLSSLVFQASVVDVEYSQVWLDEIILYPGECPSDDPVTTTPVSISLDDKTTKYVRNPEQSTLVKRSHVHVDNVYVNANDEEDNIDHTRHRLRKVRKASGNRLQTASTVQSPLSDDDTMTSMITNMWTISAQGNATQEAPPVELSCTDIESEVSCWTCAKPLMAAGCDPEAADSGCQPDKACDTQSISCAFESGCGCGYEFMSSNTGDVWHVMEEGNATDLVFTDGAAVVSGSADVGDWTVLSSPMSPVTTVSCLEFMYSTKYVNLRLYTYDLVSQSERLAISLDGMERTWHKAAATLNAGFYGIAFQFTFAGKGEAAIDSITLQEGPCHEKDVKTSLECTFDDVDLCGHMDVTENGRRMWFRSKNHDEASPGGFHVRTTEISHFKLARDLLSPAFTAHSESCLQFYYFMHSPPADEMATISLLLLSDADDISSGGTVYNRSSDGRYFVWGVRGITDSNWHGAQAMVPPGEFQLLIEVNGVGVRGGVDDLTLTPGVCPELECGEEEFRCLDREACIPSNHAQDGVNHCFLGDDEEETECAVDDDECLNSPAPDPAHKDGKDDKENKEKRDAETLNVARSRAEEYIEDVQNAPIGNITSVADMYTKLGPELSEMLHTCRWEGMSCDEEMFTRRVTDYGLCYSFNFVNDSGNAIIETAKTGSRYGLSIKLNIEQFEYMKGPYSDAGVKVFLHDSDEQPQVRDLGFAVAPGTHTLAGIRVNEAVSLEPPWGECGVQPLKYLKNKRYTYSNCIIENEADELLKACLCTDAYMPASDNFPTCDIHEYFACAVPHLYGTHDDAIVYDGDVSTSGYVIRNATAGDPCRKSCQEILYEVSLSYASLSAFSVDQILSLDGRLLQTRVDRALEASYRTSPKEFAANLAIFLEIPQMYKQYAKFVRTFTGDTATNVWHAIQTLGRLFTEDIEKLLGSTQRQFDVYTMCYDGTQNLLSRLMETFKSHMLHNQQQLYLSGVQGKLHSTLKESLKDATTEIDSIQETLQLALTKFSNASIAVSAESDAGAVESDLAFLPAKFFLDEISCNSTARDLSQSLQSLRAIYADLQQMEDRHDKENFADLSSRLSNNASTFVQLWDKGRQCFTKYRELLVTAMSLTKANKTRIWTDISPIKVDESLDKAISNLYGDETRISLDIQRYVANTISKRQLLDSLLTGDGSKSKTHTHVSSLTDKVRDRMIMPLSTILLNLRIELQREYQGAMSIAAVLQNYFPSGFFYDKADAMTIWKVPRPDPADHTAFTTDDRELWRIWDRDVPIAEFTEEGCVRYIGEALASFVEPLQDKLTSAGQQLSIKNQELVAAIEKVEEIHEWYNWKRTIDHEFVLKNFLHLDIYFKQLKYQLITQMKAYDISQFWSDVGGIMGLLLGCSVLSVFEFVDFFVYNGLRKLCGGNNKTADSESGKHNDVHKFKAEKEKPGLASPVKPSTKGGSSYFDASSFYGIDFAHI